MCSTVLGCSKKKAAEQKKEEEEENQRRHGVINHALSGLGINLAFIVHRIHYF